MEVSKRNVIVFAQQRFTVWLAIALLMSTNDALAQTRFDFTTASARKKHDAFLVDSIIKKPLQYPISNVTEKEWQKAFWAMQLMLYKEAAVETKLREAWNSVHERTEGFQKALLEVSYTLYPASFTESVTELLNKTKYPGVFVRSAEYLLLTGEEKPVLSLVEKKIHTDFNSSTYAGLEYLVERLSDTSKQTRVSFAPLFSQDFLKGETIIYSLQRKNRDNSGIVIIRKRDGEFVKNSDGSIFYVQQLARSITNYPYYITNGNTPQGIFRWTGFDTSDNNYIGPTTNLQMVMPLESSPAVFFNNHTLVDSQWTKQKYASLLPPSLRFYKPLYESYKAGVIGRSEIIMHGTTINPAYYQGRKYFPNTPSLGCLCSFEKWNSDGQLTYSNQKILVDILFQIGAKSGYVVVLEIDSTNDHVSIKDAQKLTSDF